ncbi:MAG TPA: hypothetical protein VFM23_03580 [Gemmatimonadales bacterium]|nr:hypothetical protein [Gemmatimonadales bacterium]
MRRLKRALFLAAGVALTIPAAGTAQSPPPRIGGAALGDAPSAVIASMGRPDRRQEYFGYLVWDYLDRGVTVMIDRDQRRVRVVVLSKRDAGAVEGVRVGDRLNDLTAAWGAATRVRQDGRFRDFARHGWFVTVEVQNSSILEITVQLTSLD